VSELIVPNDGQLTRVERAIKVFEARTGCESLLTALRAERATLLYTQQPRTTDVKVRRARRYLPQAATAS
jgi:hypothetical protein